MEGQAALFLKLVIIEEHCIQTCHQEKVSRVHDVLFDDRVCPGLPELSEVRVKKLASEACIEPVTPDFATEHFVDDAT